MPPAGARPGRHYNRFMMHAAFPVMVKPVSAACNLQCRYCYYLGRPDGASPRRMSRETLEALIREVIAAQPEAREIHFAWQGGEPTLAGIDFFREALALQNRYRPSHARIVNALQTNGTLVDAEWARFFAEHDFLVGISIDGPAALHDRLRRDHDGRATHAKVMRGLEALQRAGTQFNSLTAVHKLNCRSGHAVYRYLRRLGVRHMQFIPLVERQDAQGFLAAPPPGTAHAPVAPSTAPRDAYGEFLCAVFDDWLANDAGTIFVQAIEEYVAALAGKPAGLCTFAAHCSSALMAEANGDLYSCDHYAFPAYRLGTLGQDRVEAMLQSGRHRAFVERKGRLPDECRPCEFFTACRGGCPKHRFIGVPGGNYLCPSYRRFFSHAARALAPFAAVAALEEWPRCSVS